MSKSELEPPLRSPELIEHFEALTGVGAIEKQHPQRFSKEVAGDKKRELTGGDPR